MVGEPRRSLIGVVLYGFLAAVLVLSLRPSGVAGLLAAPLLVVCPGYALTCALGGGTNPLEVAVRTVALSFASAALGGLVLNAIGVGLDARSWAILMLVITVGAACVAFRRRGAVARPLSHSPSRSAGSLTTGVVAAFAATTGVAAGFAVIGLLVVAAVVAHDSESAVDVRQSTTQLSAAVDPSAPHTLRILVGNSQASAARYRVLIRGSRARIDIPLALRRGQSRVLVVQRARWSAHQPVTVRLVRAARPDKTYRAVTIR